MKEKETGLERQRLGVGKGTVALGQIIQEFQKNGAKKSETKYQANARTRIGGENTSRFSFQKKSIWSCGGHF